MAKAVPLVDEIALVLIDAIDDLIADKTTEDAVIKIIKEIVSVRAERLKILDGKEAKSRFASKMGKRRLEKFYPLLEAAER